jgi:NAD+ synthase (glutamine-hydrolysing)
MATATIRDRANATLQELLLENVALPAAPSKPLDSAGTIQALEQTRTPFRVAVSQWNPLPSAIQHNRERIQQEITKAEQAGAQLLVLPELALSGYLALDHFSSDTFTAACVEALKDLCECTRGKEVAIAVGFPRPSDDSRSSKPYNSVAILQDGAIIGISDKSLLPDYDIFWEHRYFQPGDLRRPIEISGRMVGFQICEDLWDHGYPVKVSDELVANGAEILVNLSASPFTDSKQKLREALVSGVAKRLEVPFVYANMVGAQDGYEGEVIFDGRSMIVARTGELVAQAKAFAADFVVADLFSAATIPVPEIDRIDDMCRALVTGIRDYFQRNGFKRAYIGLSGGIDSALTAALAVEALGAENVIGVTMPSKISSKETVDDALLLAERLGIRCDRRPICDLYDTWHDDFVRAHGKEPERITKQNAQARFRGLRLVTDYSNEDREGLVLSTGNKTEIALGYCTLYGDMAGGLSVIGDLNKLDVFAMARHINERAKRELIPQTTIDRVPSAELEPGQTDRDNLPADYPILAPLVDKIIEQSATYPELVAELSALGVTNAAAVVDRTVRMVQVAEYKRRQAAPAIKLTGKSFGAGRRYPVMRGGFFDSEQFKGS